MSLDTLEYAKKLEAPRLAEKRDIAELRTELKADLDTAVARIEGKLLLLQWMLGFVLATMLAVLWKLLR